MTVFNEEQINSLPQVRHCKDRIIESYQPRQEHINTLQDNPDSVLEIQDWIMFIDESLFIRLNAILAIFEEQFTIRIFELTVFDSIVECDIDRKFHIPARELINENLN